MTALWVAVAGATGSLLRWRLGVAFGSRPATTLAINASGSYLLAVLMSGPWTSRLEPTLVTALGTGLLGAYTTFSTFSHETMGLVREGRVTAAMGYVAATLAAGLLAAAAGWATGRALA
jgi:CrcB protein